MYTKAKNFIGTSLSNAKGWKSSTKIVVIESDDWGTIRMPSKKAFASLMQKGIRVDESFYDRIDSLEKREDLLNLFNVLHENTTNNSKPKFTFNTVMQNPDFDKIKEYKFEKFIGLNLFDSYQKYYGEDLESLWDEAIKEGIIIPQFHAREHLSASLWMKDLNLGLEQTRTAFDFDFFALKTQTSSKLRAHYLATYFTETADELDYVKDVLKDGMKQFENIFSLSSKSFIASNYVWPNQLEETLQELNVISIQGQRKQVNSDYIEGTINYLPHYTGQRNSFGQIYTVRNVLFEPYLDQNKNWADSAFKEVENAFFWNTPAIISTHRINYASNMSMQNRDSSLRYLDSLLKKINTKFPDAIYMSSDEFAELITNTAL